MVLESSDSEDEGTPRPLSSAGRASRSPSVPGKNPQEEQTVPSVVANRTRQKSKAAASPQAPSQDRGSEDGDDRVAGKKRKVEGGVEEGGKPSKKPKAGAGRSKATATRKPAVRKK
jgi:hypothetical protein